MLSTFLAMAKWAAHHSRNSINDSSPNRQVEELTENKYILNKYTITQFLENEVFPNIEISQVSPGPAGLVARVSDSGVRGRGSIFTRVTILSP